MWINTKLDQPVKINRQQVDEVEVFTYLGLRVTKEGGVSENIVKTAEGQVRFLSIKCGNLI